MHVFALDVDDYDNERSKQKRSAFIRRASIQYTAATAILHSGAHVTNGNFVSPVRHRDSSTLVTQTDGALTTVSPRPTPPQNATDYYVPFWANNTSKMSFNAHLSCWVCTNKCFKFWALVRRRPEGVPPAARDSREQRRAGANLQFCLLVRITIRVLHHISVDVLADRFDSSTRFEYAYREIAFVCQIQCAPVVYGYGKGRIMFGLYYYQAALAFYGHLKSCVFVCSSVLARIVPA